jgi:hypothetical protein
MATDFTDGTDNIPETATLARRLFLAGRNGATKTFDPKNGPSFWPPTSVPSAPSVAGHYRRIHTVMSESFRYFCNYMY